MKPGAEVLVDLAVRLLPPSASVADIGGPPAPPPALAARRVTHVREDEALPYLEARALDPLDAAMVAWPTAHAPLLPFLAALRGALRPEGIALLMDVTWQTAPTPELIRAFAPAAGREKVRPVEGYEMQLEHAGFDIRERIDIDRALWVPQLPDGQRAAVEADARGAARLRAWVLAPSIDA